jgi:L-lactate dehydrogenase complex protein LldG
MSSSRDAILSRLRNGLSHEPARELPPVPEVWPETHPSAEAMVQQFEAELKTVSGELVRCDSMDAARAKLAAMMQENGWNCVASHDRPLCREATKSLDASKVAWASPDWTPPSVAEFPLGLIEADYLMADTGTAMVCCNRPEERLTCYLPPACIVVATLDRLREHLPAAWKEIAPRVAEPDRRGEFVFITGPSRTADIEKILILGVHGPKRLIVLLVG